MSDSGNNPPPYPQGGQPPYPQGGQPPGYPPQQPQQPQQGGYPPPAPYGQPGQSGYPAAPEVPAQRPGKVLAGCIMAWIGGGLGTLLGLVLLASPDSIAEASGMDVEASQLAVAGSVLMVLSVIAVVFAFFAFQRQRWAAIALFVLAIVVLLLALVSTLTGTGNPLGGLYSAVSAYLVYGTKDAKAWFAGAPRA